MQQRGHARRRQAELLRDLLVLEAVDLAQQHRAGGQRRHRLQRRLHAGQRLARSGAGQDFIESSVIDARLRQLEAQRRALMEESRGRGGQREPAQ